MGSVALHIATRYEHQENDPKELLVQARAEREALMANALVQTCCFAGFASHAAQKQKSWKGQAQEKEEGEGGDEEK